MSAMAMFRAWVIALVLAGGTAHAQTTDFWGARLPGQPVNFIFGYGSLINTASRNATASKPVPAIPVRVAAAFGYVRSWSERSPSGFTALGLRRPIMGEAPMTINGVLYPVFGNDMTAFDEREAGYLRVEVPRALIEPVSWQPMPGQGTVWVYVPKTAGSAPGQALPLANARFPLLESYIDVVIEGGLEYGPEFAREIIETTRDWSPYWLNDRVLARRPWVFDHQFTQVDALLASWAPCFAHRAFSEDYAARNLKKATISTLVRRKGTVCSRSNKAP